MGTCKWNEEWSGRRGEKEYPEKIWPHRVKTAGPNRRQKDWVKEYVSETLVEGMGLNKQRETVWIKKGGDFSTVTIPLRELCIRDYVYRWIGR